MKPPEPETKFAWLPSQGCNRVTRHFFKRTLEANQPGPEGEIWEFMFECSETGAQRRWGIVDRSVVGN